MSHQKVSSYLPHQPSTESRRPSGEKGPRTECVLSRVGGEREVCLHKAAAWTTGRGSGQVPFWGLQVPDTVALAAALFESGAISYLGTLSMSLPAPVLCFSPL